MTALRNCAMIMIPVVSLFGCGSGEPGPAATPKPQAAAPSPALPAKPATGLGGRVWDVTEIGGAALDLAADARRPTIEFDTAANAAHGFAGCNTFRGNYKSGNGAIRLGPFAVTRMACLGGDEVERNYLAAMAQTQTYRVSADVLEFIGADGSVMVRFAPRATEG